MVWLGVKWIEEWSADTIVDRQTGEVHVDRRDGGSLFFIPSRYWPHVLVGLSVLMYAGSWRTH